MIIYHNKKIHQISNLVIKSNKIFKNKLIFNKIILIINLLLEMIIKIHI